jgi:transposase InsO family protein
MSVARRQARQHHQEQRCAEQSARCHVVEACRAVQARDVPVADVTRCLGASERTVRRWREGCSASPPAPRGRPPRCATRRQRNEVYRFLHQRGTSTPLAAVRAAFPELRRADLNEIAHRFRRIQQRKAQRHRSRLEWLQPGTVWAADFKERREPIEGRYGWFLSIKDLASRYQLAWLPLTEATAEAVQAMYARLFAEHGPPLVMKTDNGGPLRADGTKQLLAEHQVVPLFSPKRRPQYNGGVERANGQVAGYQEAVAEFRGRPAGPTCEDAETARRLVNELARPAGWQGPTAGQLWAARQPISEAKRATFRATVDQHRAEVRAAWEFPPDEALDHDQASAIDRRAVRDALVGHDLLRIHPRREKRGSKTKMPAPPPATIAPGAAIMQPVAKLTAPPTVGGALDRLPHVAAAVQQPCEEAQLLHHKNDC